MKTAIIASAGYGSRLGDITKNIPKPMIEIGGKTVLQRIIENLHSHNISKIIINCHYLPMIITSKVGSNALYFYEERLLGQDGTISALKRWIDDDFFYCNGDTISNINYTDMIANHKPGTILAAMESWRCVGTWLYSSEYFDNPNISVVPYRPQGLIWHDIGTPERLAEAKKYYE